MFLAEVCFVFEILCMQKNLYLWSRQHVMAKTVISLKMQQNIDLLQRATLKSVNFMLMYNRKDVNFTQITRATEQDQANRLALGLALRIRLEVRSGHVQCSVRPRKTISTFEIYCMNRQLTLLYPIVKRINSFCLLIHSNCKQVFSL